MPFTFAHPAAIIPFRKLNARWRSWTGLIVGSIIPDFEGFVRLGAPKWVSHSWAGMFWLDLPAGILTAFIFHLLVRDVLIVRLPSGLSGRFARYKGFDWIRYFKRNFIVVILSMLVGIFTHLVWDRLTHTDTFNVPSRVGIELSWYDSYMLRQWLQALSSVAGILIIAWQVWRLPEHKPKMATTSWVPYWLLVCAVTVATTAARLNADINEGVFFHALCSGLICGLIVASAAARLSGNKAG